MNASDVLNRLTDHKLSQGPLLALLRREDEKTHDLVKSCGSWLHIREWLKTGETRVRNANFCGKFLLCRSCAARRAAKLVAKYAEKVATVTVLQPDLQPVMITLTLKNQPECKPMFDDLRSTWKAMMAAARKGKSLSGRHEAIEFNKVHGFLRSVEVTNKGKGWHWHLHVFALVTDWIDREKLSEEWQRFGGGKIVDVRKLYGEQGAGIVAGLIECLKYVTKMGEMTPAHVWEVAQAAKGSRMTNPGGCLLGVPEPDIRQDDDADQSGPYRDFLASWMGNGYRLRQMSDEMPDEPLEATVRRVSAAAAGQGTVTAADLQRLHLAADDPAQRAALEAALGPFFDGQSASENR